MTLLSGKFPVHQAVQMPRRRNREEEIITEEKATEEITEITGPETNSVKSLLPEPSDIFLLIRRRNNLRLYRGVYEEA